MSVIEKLDGVLANWRSRARRNAVWSRLGGDEIVNCADELDALMPAIRQAMIDAERWRYLKDERTGHYGDGYSEPNEAHLVLEWQQGPWIHDGSDGGRGRPDVFPGWDAIVDEMMANAASELADLDDAAINKARATGEGEGNG